MCIVCNMREWHNRHNGQIDSSVVDKHANEDIKCAGVGVLSGGEQ